MHHAPGTGLLRRARILAAATMHRTSSTLHSRSGHGGALSPQQTPQHHAAAAAGRRPRLQGQQQQHLRTPLVVPCVFRRNNDAGGGAGGNSSSSGPQQQGQVDLERLRQQGGYGYPPPRSAQQQQQPQQPQPRQPWAWPQDQQQQQQQQYGAPGYAPDSQPEAGSSGGRGRGGSGGGSGGGDGGGGLSGYTKALIAAAFVTGLGAGVYFDAEINLSPNQVASTEIIDRRTPNAEVCMAYGYSAMVFDQRVFVTYNPFNLYVTQPEVKPGCILRRSNVSLLEREKLVTDKQVESCKKRMNTFGFVGDLSGDPEVSCVYHSEEAENQYLLQPDKGLQLGEGPPRPAAAAAAAAGGKP